MRPSVVNVTAKNRFNYDTQQTVELTDDRKESSSKSNKDFQVLLDNYNAEQEAKNKEAKNAKK